MFAQKGSMTCPICGKEAGTKKSNKNIKKTYCSRKCMLIGAKKIFNGKK